MSNEPRAYYDEHDKFCAGWLRNLAASGLIAPGHIDDRDVRDILPTDLDGYRQVHLFAGIGLWSHALRLAGWGDDRPVWTISCPCQPFSQAGGGAGVFDDRHLWPAAHWLVAQQRPCTIFGEQVASADGLAWFDIVSADLEALGYTCGPLDFPSAGVGAPNIRQRLYWVADAYGERCAEGRRDHAAPGHDLLGCSGTDGAGLGCAEGTGSSAGPREPHAGHRAHQSERSGDAGGMAYTEGERQSEYISKGTRPDNERRAVSNQHRELSPGIDGCHGRLGDAGDARLSNPEPQGLCGSRRWSEGRATEQSGRALHPWREPEWVECIDTDSRTGQRRWRPFESGAFPLAPRHPGDVAKLRAYGNAINPFVAAEVIRSWMDLRNAA